MRSRYSQIAVFVLNAISDVFTNVTYYMYTVIMYMASIRWVLVYLSNLCTVRELCESCLLASSLLVTSVTGARVMST